MPPHDDKALQNRSHFPKWAANLYARNARRPNGVLNLAYGIIANDVDVRDATSTGKVLDVGCGPGKLSLLVASRMEGVEVIGLDLSPSMVVLASEEAEGAGLGGRLRFIEGNVLSIPFPDATFDTVMSSFSLHEWPSLDVAIGEILRVLKKGGRVLLFSAPSAISKVANTYLKSQVGWFDATFIRMITGACKKAWAHVENYLKTLEGDVIISSVVISGFIQKLSIRKR